MLSSFSTCFDAHREPGTFVVVEGTPGAGKTLALTAVAEKTNAAIVAELNHVVDARVSAQGTLDLDRWYVGAERARQPHLRRLLREGRAVLQDRGLVSTLAFVYASSDEPTRLERLLTMITECGPFICPDAIVIMRTEVCTGLRRRSTFQNDPAYRRWFDQEFLTRYDAFYRLVAPGLLRCPTFQIDTSSLSRSSTVDILSQTLRVITAGHQPAS